MQPQESIARVRTRRWKGHLDKLLANISKAKRVQHHPALEYKDMSAFMAELRGKPFTSARALEFLILTAARTGEVIYATWEEINLVEKTWTVPAGRMKARKEHKVPLSDRAMAILAELPREEGSDFIFIGSKKAQPLSNTAMLELMKEVQPDYVPHGFRATFRTWCAESTSYPHHVCEAALAHAIPDAVVRSYQRGDLFTKRRKLMADWARHCGQSPASIAADNVTPIRQQVAS